MISTSDWKIQSLKKKMFQNFLALHHLPFKRHISTTVAPNLARSGSFETRHLELSKHINFEENRAQKRPPNS